ncbi:MAG: L,D-transpeptidase [Rhodothermales bacterium]|nr:L,D-transpeptidase [Rhodothermales bacterium]
MLRRLPVLFAVLTIQLLGPAAQAQSSRPAGFASEGAPAAAASEARTDAPWVVEDAPISYVTEDGTAVFSRPDSALAFMRLGYHEGVRVLEERQDGWTQIQRGKARGWIASRAVSNVWIYVDKESRTLYLYRGTELVRSFPADVSQNDADKVRRSALGEKEHYRIPEGTFYVVRKNPNSQYYRSFLINYPTAEDAERGFREGIISEADRDRIVEAAERFEAPPMGTRLGGAIAIHGQGSGRRQAWTRGCVALRDVHMDVLWELVEEGTPVLIR